MAAASNLLYVVLREDDVPGAKMSLDHVEKAKLYELQRWLQCHGLKKSGRLAEVRQRVKDAMTTGVQVDEKIDGGVWLDKRQNELKAQHLPNQQVNEGSKAAGLPTSDEFADFPSVPLPRYFNEGAIYGYIVDSATFEGEGHELVDPDEVRTAKPLKRGKSYFDSGCVTSMKDCCIDNVYFLSCKVMSSFQTSTLYNVNIKISNLSGSVTEATCTCKASAMGRCAHVAGTLFALNNYMLNFQSEVSCTSKRCEWNVGRQKSKNPSKIFSTAYKSNSHPVGRLIDFNPVGDSSASKKDICDRLHESVKLLGRSSCFLSMFQSQHEDYNVDDERMLELKMLRGILLQHLSPVVEEAAECKNLSPIEICKDQGSSVWHNERDVRITASEAKDFFAAKQQSRIANLLRGKLYTCTHFQTKAMAYGHANEENARQQYVLKTGFQVLSTGLWINPNFPELSCSPDGLVFDTDVKEKGLLEIKCPLNLETSDVNDFDSVLSKDQLSRFCLHRGDDNTIHLKRSHAYYYQVLFQMGVMNLQWCDFIVWSKHGMFVERIYRNGQLWDKVRDKLIDFHHRWICPEYFEMRIPRKLSPIELV